MGMSSYFEHQEIKVLDADGLIKGKKQLADKDWGMFILDDGSIDFDQFCGWKIYSYFYSEMCEAFAIAAQFIEGYAEFRYEEGDLFRIVFKDKKWYIQESEVQWCEPKELHR